MHVFLNSNSAAQRPLNPYGSRQMATL